jgi:fatty acid desaturase
VADPIPVRLNLLLVAGSTGVAAASLAIASHAASWPVALAAAAVFSFVNNTVFSLLHEAVHGVLHPDPRVNTWLGRWLAAFFPTGFGFQRAAHLGHHRRNRSPVERFDYIGPGDVVWLKWAQWYALLTGWFWVLSVFATTAYLVFPGSLESLSAALAPETSAQAYADGLLGRDRTRLRLEIALSYLVQAALFTGLGGSLAGWALCYGAFALNWCSLQYADHAWSPLDAREGAWNLRVNPVVRAVFLNYHLHLAHHRHPSVPWLHLPSKVDPAEPQPSFLAIWTSMWRGPRPLPPEAP